MKKISLMCILLTGASLVGCKGPSPADKVLRGAHALVAFPNKQYFNFQNLEDSVTTDNTVIIFQWKDRERKIHLTALPYKNVHADYSEKSKTPTIRFRWSRYDQSVEKVSTDTIVKNCVETAYIKIAEKDWPLRSNRQYAYGERLTR